MNNFPVLFEETKQKKRQNSRLDNIFSKQYQKSLRPPDFLLTRNDITSVVLC